MPSYIKNPNYSLEKSLSLYSYKNRGCNRLIQCHYSGNFARRDMMALKYCILNNTMVNKLKILIEMLFDIMSYIYINIYTHIYNIHAYMHPAP